MFLAGKKTEEKSRRNKIDDKKDVNKHVKKAIAKAQVVTASMQCIISKY
jgi:hypothetical protein